MILVVCGNALNAYGTPRFAVDGWGVATEQGPAREEPTAFRIAHLQDGTLLVGLLTGTWLHDVTDLSGQTTDGWTVEAHGLAVTSSRSGSGQGGNYSEVVATAPAVTMTRSGPQPPRNEPSFVHMSAELVDFLAEKPIDVRLKSGRLMITPTEGFRRSGRMLVAGSRVTHRLSFDGWGTVDSLRQLLETVERALTFMSGALVDHVSMSTWFFKDENYRELRNPVTRAKSGHPFGLGGLVDFGAAMEAFSSSDSDRARYLSHGYADAASGDAFLESRALIAVALIESLLPTPTALPDEIREQVESAAKAAALAVIDARKDLDATTQQRLRENVALNTNRVADDTFRRLLRTKLTDANVLPGGTRRTFIQQVVETRNALVHRFSFAGTDDFDEYRRLLWLALALCVRELGYPHGFGAYPPPFTAEPIDLSQFIDFDILKGKVPPPLVFEPEPPTSPTSPSSPPTPR